MGGFESFTSIRFGFIFKFLFQDLFSSLLTNPFIWLNAIVGPFNVSSTSPVTLLNQQYNRRPGKLAEMKNHHILIHPFLFIYTPHFVPFISFRPSFHPFSSLFHFFCIFCRLQNHFCHIGTVCRIFIFTYFLWLLLALSTFYRFSLFTTEKSPFEQLFLSHLFPYSHLFMIVKSGYGKFFFLNYCNCGIHSLVILLFLDTVHQIYSSKNSRILIFMSITICPSF